MIALSNSLKSLQNTRCHRFAVLWKLTRKDGVIYRFTDHSSKIVFNTETYVPSGGFNASAISRLDSLRGQNAEIVGLISSSAITTEALREKRFEGATVLRYLVDWKYPFAGAFQTDKYYIRNIKFNGENWDAELEGITALLKQAVGEFFTANCRYELGDARCQFNLPSLKIAGASVSSATSRMVFTSSNGGFAGKVLDYFQFGVIEWKTGNNAGLTSEVATSTAASGNSIVFTLFEPTVLNIVASETFDIVPGCDKQRLTCKNKFNNFVNFGGFPDMPGGDDLLETPT